MINVLAPAGQDNQSASEIPAGGVHITDGFCLRGNRDSSRCQRLSRAEVHGRLSRPLNAYQILTDEQLQQLYVKDDHGAVQVSGQTIAVEQAADSLSQSQVTQLKDGITQVFTSLNANIGSQVFAEQFPLRQRPFAWCKTRGPNALIRG